MWGLLLLLLLLQEGAYLGLELANALADTNGVLSLWTWRIGTFERVSFAYEGLARKLTITSYSIDAQAVSVGVPTDEDGMIRIARNEKMAVGDLLATPTEDT